MWAKVVGTTGKHHYLVNDKSLCLQVKLKQDDYIKGNQDVKDKDKCMQCKKIIEQYPAMVPLG